MKHKKIFVAVIASVVIFLFVMAIIFMIHVKKTDAIVFKKDLTCVYRQEIYIDSFIQDLDGTLLNNDLVDTSSIGKKTIDVQYRNRYGFVEQNRIEIEVKDVVPPVINVNDSLSVNEGEVSELLDIIFCADDYDDEIKCSIDGEYNLNQIGTYPLHISAKDKSGNETEKDFTLNVVKKIEEKKKDSFVNFSDIYRRYKADNTEIGLDISKWQGDIDFKKLADQGVSFVMIKIGGQMEINGDIFMDPYFQNNIKGALEHNIKVGVYFYSYAKSESEAKKQAKWVINVIKDYDVSLPVAFDWENWERYSTFGIGFRTLNKVASSFINEIKRYQYDGILYSSKYYLENIWYDDDYTKWLAYYTSQNDYGKDYMMWQLCNNGKIDGIRGNVDIDILKTK